MRFHALPSLPSPVLLLIRATQCVLCKEVLDEQQAGSSPAHIGDERGGPTLGPRLSTHRVQAQNSPHGIVSLIPLKVLAPSACGSELRGLRTAKRLQNEEKSPKTRDRELFSLSQHPNRRRKVQCLACASPDNSMRGFLSLHPVGGEMWP